MKSIASRDAKPLGRLLRGLLKVLVSILFLLFLAILVTGVSPIYDFRAPAPFAGDDIYNPYRDLDTAYCWKRASLHTHTRVKGPFPPNESEAWPQEVYDAYKKLGFGSDRVKHWDPLLPLLASQKQFELDRLAKGADIVQINHPYRTVGMSEDHMAKLSGYELTELDTHIGTENEYWDWALSAGHYSYGVANDDLHHPQNHWQIGIRCNFLCTPSGRYEDILANLRNGCFYSMRVPNYGDGDWEVKYAKNRKLPFIEDIGLDRGTVYMKLSAPADSIRVNGQDHRTLALVEKSDSIAYAFRPEDHFARYDASVQESPFNEEPQPINWLLTVLYNLLVLGLVVATLGLWRKYLKG